MMLGNMHNHNNNINDEREHWMGNQPPNQPRI